MTCRRGACIQSSAHELGTSGYCAHYDSMIVTAAVTLALALCILKIAGGPARATSRLLILRSKSGQVSQVYYSATGIEHMRP